MHKLLLLLAIISSSAIADDRFKTDVVYKCTDQSGRTSFSDRKCGDTAEQKSYRNQESWLEKIERESKEADIRRKDREYERQAALIADRQARDRQRDEAVKICGDRLSRKGISVGMKKSDVVSERLWSSPQDISTTDNSDGRLEHYVYPCAGYKTVRLLFFNGYLQSIHD